MEGSFAAQPTEEPNGGDASRCQPGRPGRSTGTAHRADRWHAATAHLRRRGGARPRQQHRRPAAQSPGLRRRDGASQGTRLGRGTGTVAGPGRSCGPTRTSAAGRERRRHQPWLACRGHGRPWRRRRPSALVGPRRLRRLASTAPAVPPAAATRPRQAPSPSVAASAIGPAPAPRPTLERARPIG
jgi:hypothetical protein